MPKLCCWNSCACCELDLPEGSNTRAAISTEVLNIVIVALLYAQLGDFRSKHA
jgi:hypothetical protein